MNIQRRILNSIENKCEIIPSEGSLWPEPRNLLKTDFSTFPCFFIGDFMPEWLNWFLLPKVSYEG